MQTFLKLFKLASVFLGPLLVVLIGGYLWDEGYVGFYWQRYDSLYDPKLNVVRCLDEHGELANFEPPCVVMTERGRKAMERYEVTCEESGGKHDECSRKAYEWLLSKQPKVR